MNTPQQLEIQAQVKVNEVAKKIVQELERTSLSKRMLATRTGLSVNTIHNLVNGRNCTIKTLILVASALNVDPVTFFETSQTTTV